MQYPSLHLTFSFHQVPQLLWEAKPKVGAGRIGRPSEIEGLRQQQSPQARLPEDMSSCPVAKMICHSDADAAGALAACVVQQGKATGSCGLCFHSNMLDWFGIEIRKRSQAGTQHKATTRLSTTCDCVKGHLPADARRAFHWQVHAQRVSVVVFPYAARCVHGSP